MRETRAKVKISCSQMFRILVVSVQVATEGEMEKQVFLHHFTDMWAPLKAYLHVFRQICVKCWSKSLETVLQ